MTAGDRDFALLLSKAYDGDLAPSHHADLKKSGLSQETIAAHYIRSVPPHMIGRLLGFDVPAVHSAYLLPFRSPDGGFMNHIRMKIFPALTSKDGHTVKYLGPRGVPPRVYFCAAALGEVLEGEAPLWCVEGAKKALAVSQLGLPTIGFEGVEGWHTKGSRALLADFDQIRLQGRVVELLPDGDYQTNPNVERAIRRFGAALAAQGARPRVVLLPDQVRR